MKYRIVERYYGPDIRYNDWRVHAGRKERAAGALQFYAAPDARLQRVDYPFGGGGDVEITLTVSFDRFGPDGSLTVHFNDRKRTEAAEGFRVIFDAQHVTVRLRDTQVGQAPADSVERDTAHTIRLVTLAESYEVHYNGAPICAGDMPAPFTDNEGELFLNVHDADVRLLGFTENFIAHDIEFPAWERKELLYTETFGESSFNANWYCNKGDPPAGVGFEPGAFVFRHMSNSFIRRRFEAPVAMDCTVTPVPTAERSAEVTDAIVIWMIDRPDGGFFEFLRAQESASLFNLMGLPFYWVDFGGTNNVTTRMRKNPHRHMVRQFTDPARLLKRHTSYRVTVVANGNFIEYHVDGQPWITVYDPTPLTGGYLGFRAYCAGLKVEDLKVWRVGP